MTYMKLLLYMALAACSRKVEGLSTGSCKNGGVCSNETGGMCEPCQCPQGFAGNTCDEHVTRVDGSITYNITDKSLAPNQSAFENQLKVYYPTYQRSQISIINETAANRWIITYVLYYLMTPVSWQAINVTKYQKDAIEALKQPAVTNNVFSTTTGVAVFSASVDIDECASRLFICHANEKCKNENPNYRCVCKDGYSGNPCTGITCKLSEAPNVPSFASRNVILRNGSDITNLMHDDTVPHKTYIEFTCRTGYKLISSVSGKAETTIAECVGRDDPTNKSNGWSGGEFSCAIELAFTVAIIMATVSSVIIVLVGGAFIVSCSKKKEVADKATLEMDTSF